MQSSLKNSGWSNTARPPFTTLNISRNLRVNLILPTHVKQKKVSLRKEILSSMPFTGKQELYEFTVLGVMQVQWKTRAELVESWSQYILSVHEYWPSTHKPNWVENEDQEHVSFPIIRKNHYFSLGVLTMYRWVKMLEKFSFSLH